MRTARELLDLIRTTNLSDTALGHIVAELFSTPRVQVGFTENEIVTTIPAADTYVQVTDSITESVAEQFELDTDTNEVRYTDRPERDFLVHTRLQCENANGLNRPYTFGLSINGTVDPGVLQQVRTEEVDPVIANFAGLVSLSHDDVVRLEVKNDEDDADILVRDLQLTIVET